MTVDEGGPGRGGEGRPADRSGATRSDLSGSAGDVVQARDVHGGVHFHGIPGPGGARPLQLPADVRGFVDRTAELELLDAILSVDGESPPEIGVFVIVGTAGVGKTSLAVHWAHRVRDRFPDGQLVVNLRGYDPGRPVPSQEALDRFLRALDVPPRAIPTELEARAALYRSLLAERRVLLLLDNAAGVGQVRPLLPGSANCLVLVTSRNRLSGLVVRDGAHRLTLDMLPEPDAVSLLRVLTSRHRQEEPVERLEELARLCARLPLALRIAAERAASRPWMPLDDLIRDLRDESALWDALTAEDDEEADAVRTVFAWSYRALPQPAARLFRLLGMYPGTDFSIAVTAVLLRSAVATARSLLDTLVGAHLIEQTGPDRFQLHDLLRAYAVDQAQEESPEFRRATTKRVLTWYLHTAQAAETRIGALDLRIALPPLDADLTIPVFATESAAADWLDAERGNLVAGMRVAAADPDLSRFAWQIPTVLRSYYMRHNLFEDWFATGELALAAARRTGDRAGEVEILDSLGTAHVAVQQLDLGADLHYAALALRRDLGDRLGEAVSLNALGLTALRGRRLDEAGNHFSSAAAVFAELDEVVWGAVADANLGETQYELTQYRQAAESVRKALAVFRTAGDPQGTGNALRLLSGIDRATGQERRALSAITEAVAIAVEHDNHMWEGYWLIELGSAHIAVGQPAEALITCQRSATIQRRLGDRIREARALDVAGEAYQRLGRPADAIKFHWGAVTILRPLGDPWQLSIGLDNLATAFTSVADDAKATSSWREAMQYLTPFTDPKAIEMRERITGSLGDQSAGHDNVR